MFNQLALQPRNGSIGLSPGEQRFHLLLDQDYTAADVRCALRVHEVALDDAFLSLIHRAKIDSVLTKKPQALSENEIRSSGILKRGLAGKLLDLHQEADRKSKVDG